MHLLYNMAHTQLGISRLQSSKWRRKDSQGPGCSTYLGVLLCRHPTGCWGRGTPWLPPLRSPVHTVHAGSANLYCKNKNTWGQKFPVFSCGIFRLWRRIKQMKKQISQDHTQKEIGAIKPRQRQQMRWKSLRLPMWQLVT